MDINLFQEWGKDIVGNCAVFNYDLIRGLTNDAKFNTTNCNAVKFNYFLNYFNTKNTI
jgi:hypothetical protein